jgi:hypothetical protein
MDGFPQRNRFGGLANGSIPANQKDGCGDYKEISETASAHTQKTTTKNKPFLRSRLAMFRNGTYWNFPRLHDVVRNSIMN